MRISDWSSDVCSSDLLLARHWVITDANGNVEEVRGDGVVGEQPRIEPGEQFTYTSGAVLATAVGTMEGSYGMVGDDGTQFDRSEEHTSELQSLMRISYAVFCLKKKT